MYFCSCSFFLEILLEYCQKGEKIPTYLLHCFRCTLGQKFGWPELKGWILAKSKNVYHTFNNFYVTLVCSYELFLTLWRYTNQSDSIWNLKYFRFYPKIQSKIEFLDFQKIAEGVRGSHYDFWFTKILPKVRQTAIFAEACR